MFPQGAGYVCVGRIPEENGDGLGFVTSPPAAKLFITGTAIQSAVPCLQLAVFRESSLAFRHNISNGNVCLVYYLQITCIYNFVSLCSL